MAKDQGAIPTSLRPRGAARASPASDGPPKKRTSVVQFFREVRAEGRKVTWTTWKETWITSVMVGIMVIMTAFFFFGVDWILNIGMSGVLKLAGAG